MLVEPLLAIELRQLMMRSAEGVLLELMLGRIDEALVLVVTEALRRSNFFENADWLSQDSWRLFSTAQSCRNTLI